MAAGRGGAAAVGRGAVGGGGGAAAVGGGGAGWGAALGRGARRALLRGGAAACAGLALLWAAIFLYGAFYCACAPAAALARPVHFHFRSDCAAPPPQLCSFPRANVSLLGERRQPVLQPGQLYRLCLELEVPESGPNRALGPFMVALSTHGADGRPLASAARPAMLRYRSRLLRALETLAFGALFLAGAAEQKQTLEIELSGRYREDPYSPTAGAVLELRSTRLQFYGARLRVHAHFSGLRYLLYHFPLSSALLGVAANSALLALALLGGYLRWACRGRRPRPAPQAQPMEEPGAPREEEEEAPPCEEPEELGPTAPSEEPPPLEEEEGEGREEEEEKEAPTPPPPRGGPSPTLRRRPLCPSS